MKYNLLMSSTHSKGLMGELAFILKLIESGYNVLTPVNPNSCYDLAIEKNGKFNRLQVKYCTPAKGILRIELYRPKRSPLSYKDRGVDIMGAYDPLNKKFYLIPLDKIGSKDEIWLRLERPKNKQSKRVHMAKDFEII